ncbi:hypothetical protein JXA31_08400 [Candidatus Bathyarchaeota archaeon]|nr:hypothetical protein [Candidatus Bathyarchaeota archaeon]
MWATAAIGLTAGVGDYPLAVVVTFIVVIILASNTLQKNRTRKRIDSNELNNRFL